MVANLGESIKTFCFFSKVKQSVSENFCYNNSVISNDPDAFYSSFTSLISSNAKTFFKTLDHFTATLLATNLARQIHQEFLKQKEQGTTHTQKTVPSTKNELDEF